MTGGLLDPWWRSMLRKTKVEFFAVPILGVEVTPVFHGLSCHSKELDF
jgi:hypothetical protein